MRLYNLIIKSSILITFLSIITTQVTYAQKYIKVESSITIEASMSEVFDVIKSLNEFKHWSPFVVEDPNQINFVEGIDGEVGSVFNWEGVDEKALGTQTLTQFTNNEYIRLECDIQKPFKGQPLFEYHLTQTKDGVLVTQAFEVGMGSFSYFMAKIFGAKGDITATNELGLARLKEYIETKQVTIVSINN